MVSVIIPTCNKHRFLDLTLASLSKQVICNQEVFEVIIVNDGKEENTKKIIDYWSKILKIRYCKTNASKGRASARNLGAEYATGEILIFIDDDMLVMPNLVQTHINAHKNNGDIMAIGYRYRLEQSTLELFSFINAFKVMANIEHIKYLPSLLDERETVYKMFDDDIEGSNAPWVCLFSNNISLRKDNFLKHKFDEIFQKKWGVEDVELGYRLYKSGIKFKLLRDAYAYHLPHAVSWRRNLRELDDNLLLFFKKFQNYEIELYADHLRVGILKYMESMRNIKERKKCKALPSTNLDTILSFYKKNIGENVFISGCESSAIIKNLNITNISALCDNIGDVSKQVNFIGTKTDYEDSKYDCVIIGSQSCEIIYPYFSLLLQEGYRISKKVLFVINENGMRNIFSFFSVPEDSDNMQMLKNIVMSTGISEKEITINEKDGVYFVCIIKDRNKKTHDKKINISFSLDLESPTEKTIAGLELAIAMYNYGANVHIQNTKRFVQFDEMDRSKQFLNDSYLYDNEKNIVRNMLINDLKLLTNDYFEVPIERFVNNTPKLIVRVDEELAGFPLNEKMEYINSEIEIILHSSEYSKAYFVRDGGRAGKSFVVPCGINANEYVPLESDNKKFIFMASGSAFKESGIDTVLNAFNSVFFGNDDVELQVYIDCLQKPYEKGFFQTDESYKIYMKFYKQYRDIYNSKIDEFRKIYKEKNSNIKIMISDFNVRKRIKHFRECDCYIHLYRSDFCGRNILKAMSCAKPVIVLSKFLPRNMCSNDNSFIVKSEITSGCEHEYIPFSEYSIWAEPDLQDCKRQLLYIYNNMEEAKQKGLNGRKNVISAWTLEYAAKNAIDSILRLP